MDTVYSVLATDDAVVSPFVGTPTALQISPGAKVTFCATIPTFEVAAVEPSTETHISEGVVAGAESTTGTCTSFVPERSSTMVVAVSTDTIVCGFARPSEGRSNARSNT